MPKFCLNGCEFSYYLTHFCYAFRSYEKVAKVLYHSTCWSDHDKFLLYTNYNNDVKNCEKSFCITQLVKVTMINFDYAPITTGTGPVSSLGKKVSVSLNLLKSLW